MAGFTAGGPPYAPALVALAAGQLAPAARRAGRVVLVVHSGAGPFAWALARAAGTAGAAVIFADAGLPELAGPTPVVDDAFLPYLRRDRRGRRGPGVAAVVSRRPAPARSSRMRPPAWRSRPTPARCRSRSSRRMSRPGPRPPAVRATCCSRPATSARPRRPASAAGRSGSCPAATCTASPPRPGWPRPSPAWPLTHRRPALSSARPAGHVQRSCRAAIGSPGHSFISARLSRAGYRAAAGPSAKARRTLAVTRRVSRPQARVRPQL